MAYVSTISTTQTSITVDIKSLGAPQNTYNGFRFRIDGGSWRYVSVDGSYTGSDSPNYTFTGLSAGTSYYIEGEAQTNAWYPADSKWASTDSGGSDPDPPVPSTTPAPTGFSMSAQSSWHVLASWNSVTGATMYEVSIFSPISLSQIVYNTSYLWGGLTPSTTYYGYVKAYTPSGGWSTISNSSFASTPRGRPDNFEWTYPKSSGALFNITAKEWNDMFVVLNAFREYKYLPNYSHTEAYTGNIFMVSQYNEARNAISAMGSLAELPPYRNSGDVIYASDINGLRDYIASIPP